MEVEIETQPVEDFRLDDTQGKNQSKPGSFLLCTRRNNSYLVPADESSNHEDFVANDTGRKMLTDLYMASYDLSAKAGKRAKRFKLLYIIMALLILSCSFVASILAYVQTDPVSVYVAASLALTSGFIKGIVVALGLEGKASLLKDCSIRLQNIGREISGLEGKVTGRKLIKKLTRYHAKVDEIELTMFGASVVSDSIGNSTGINSSTQSSTNSSE